MTTFQPDTPLDEVVRLIQAEAHSRYPIYRESLDDVIGMIHIKDVLAYWGTAKKFNLRDILRRVVFVAPTLPVLDMLLDMRRSRTHMALVVDEFGGTDGLLTIEDLVEEIVGEIEDEHDVAQTLDSFGVAVRAGHHCAQPLMDRFDLDGTTRVSMAPYNNGGDIDALTPEGWRAEGSAAR